MMEQINLLFILSSAVMSKIQIFNHCPRKFLNTDKESSFNNIKNKSNPLHCFFLSLNTVYMDISSSCSHKHFGLLCVDYFKDIFSQLELRGNNAVKISMLTIINF